jgi:hypothetical protein
MICYCLLLFGVVLYVKRTRVLFFPNFFVPFLYNHLCNHFLFFPSRDEKRGGKEAAAPPPASVTAQSVPLPGLASLLHLLVSLTSMRIRIQLFTLIRIRIRILLFIKVLGIFDHWSVTVDPPGLHSSLQASILSVDVFGLIFKSF